MFKRKIKPVELSEIIFNSLTELNKFRLKNNLEYFGKALFIKFDYNEEEQKEFLESLNILLNGGNNEQHQQ